MDSYESHQCSHSNCPRHSCRGGTSHRIGCKSRFPCCHTSILNCHHPHLRHRHHRANHSADRSGLKNTNRPATTNNWCKYHRYQISHHSSSSRNNSHHRRTRRDYTINTHPCTLHNRSTTRRHRSHRHHRVNHSENHLGESLGGALGAFPGFSTGDSEGGSLL